MAAGLYPLFLEAGYSPYLFWELTLQEITDCIDSYRVRLERKAKQQEARTKGLITILYVQAIQIAGAISYAIAGNKDGKQLPGLDVYYPELFNEKEKGDESEYTQEQITSAEFAEMENYKIRFAKFVNAHNRQFEENGGEEDR